MSTLEMPSVCPNCNRIHAVSVLKIQLDPRVLCDHCKKEYMIPLLQAQEMAIFYRNLYTMIKENILQP